MVTEAELVGRLREFLSTSDLNTTTNAIVRRKLEEDFGIDLSDRKVFIREQVDIYLQQAQEHEENNAEEDEEAEEEQEQEQENGAAKEEDDELEEPIGKGPAKRGSKKKNKKVKKRGGGFTKLCSLSPQLQKFTGLPELARTEVVKQLWSYIRENNLQDSNNRRNIICDGTLRELFGVDTIDMFQMNKALAKHIWPLETNGDSVSSTIKEKQQKKDREEEEEEPKRKEKRQKGGSSAFLASLPLSDALVKFLDTGENALPRSGVVKRIWDYIKQNNLQDPSDRRMILCDEKLKELLDVDRFRGFSVSKLLKNHFIKPEQ